MAIRQPRLIFAADFITRRYATPLFYAIDAAAARHTLMPRRLGFTRFADAFQRHAMAGLINMVNAE